MYTMLNVFVHFSKTFVHQCCNILLQKCTLIKGTPYTNLENVGMAFDDKLCKLESPYLESYVIKDTSNCELIY